MFEKVSRGQFNLLGIIRSVEVFVEFLQTDRLGWHPICGNFHSGYPGNGIEDESPVIIDCPIAVIMPADKACSTGFLFGVFAPEKGLRSPKLFFCLSVPEFTASIADHILFCGNSGSQGVTMVTGFVEA